MVSRRCRVHECPRALTPHLCTGIAVLNETDSREFDPLPIKYAVSSNYLLCSDQGPPSVIVSTGRWDVHPGSNTERPFDRNADQLGNHSCPLGTSTFESYRIAVRSLRLESRANEPTWRGHR